MSVEGEGDTSTNLFVPVSMDEDPTRETILVRRELLLSASANCESNSADCNNPCNSEMCPRACAFASRSASNFCILFLHSCLVSDSGECSLNRDGCLF